MMPWTIFGENVFGNHGEGDGRCSCSWREQLLPWTSAFPGNRRQTPNLHTAGLQIRQAPIALLRHQFQGLLLPTQPVRWKSECRGDQ